GGNSNQGTGIVELETGNAGMNIARLAKAGLWIVVAVLAITAGLFAAGRFRLNDPVQLETYVVPEDIAAEVHATLVQALSAQVLLRAGQVSLMPGGRLVVTAPASVQQGVRHLIDDIKDSKPDATPTIGFDLWIVTAQPGVANASTGMLAEIEPALAAIRNSKGPLSFTGLEKLSTFARSGRGESQVKGFGGMKVEGTVRAGEADQKTVATRIEAELELDVGNGDRERVGLETEVEARPGELIVIGQSAAPSSHGGAAEADKQIYYILRATL
ncbi:MAG: hypothetical protein ABW278_14215, partial [Steroidobacteraceae bacterium]